MTIALIVLLVLGIVAYSFLIWFSLYTWKCIRIHETIVKSPAFMWALVFFLWDVWTADYYLIYYILVGRHT